VAEKLSAATDQVASAIAEATGAVEELEKTMHTIAAGAEESSAAAEESRAAINQIEKAADSANARAEKSLRTVNEAAGYGQVDHGRYREPGQPVCGERRTPTSNQPR
jgi:methyl-accepting chemotaxis protein